MKRGLTLIELLVIITILVCLGGIICAGVGGCTMQSTGYRDGYVQKFSNKKVNWFQWSHEGELAQPGFGGAQENKPGQSSGNVWAFTVVDEKIVKQIEELDATQFVRLHYDERPFNWGHATNYVVTKVEERKPHRQVEQ